VGRALAGSGRTVVVCERLGHGDERVVRTTPEDAAAREDWRDPNVVLVLADDSVGETGWLVGAPASPARWALPDDAFDHRDGMLTKAEVRAWALARLGPGSGTSVWDVGAGSGSVAVECARFGAAVVAVERDPAQCERIRRNADAHDTT
jgi:precorrin-6Y C5,15-methyltransferase (decarboxylating)